MSASFLCVNCGREEAVVFCSCLPDGRICLCLGCEAKHSAHERFPMNCMELFQSFDRNFELLKGRIVVCDRLKEFAARLPDCVTAARAQAEARISLFVDAHRQMLEAIQSTFNNLLDSINEEIQILCSQADADVSPITQLLRDKSEELSHLGECFFPAFEVDTLTSLTKRCKDACSRSKSVQQGAYISTILQAIEKKFSLHVDPTPSPIPMRNSVTVPVTEPQQSVPSMRMSVPNIRSEPIVDYLIPKTRSILLKLGHVQLDDWESELTRLPATGTEEGIYTGQWNQRSQKHGVGMLVGKDGSVYEGDWNNGLKHGKGRQIFADGSVYIGDWVQGRMHGFGTRMIEGGASYTGEFVSGRQQGIGAKKYSDGDYYIGEFHEDKLHGHGKFLFKSGAIYSGVWAMGQMNGRFCAGEPGGILYFGDIAKDVRCGQGTRVTGDMSVYIGSWNNNKMEGQGKYAYRHEVFEGGFSNGQMVGEGAATLPDGRKFRCRCDRGVIVQYF